MHSWGKRRLENAGATGDVKILYETVGLCAVLCDTLLNCTLRHSTARKCTVLYGTVLRVRTVFGTLLYDALVGDGGESADKEPTSKSSVPVVERIPKHRNQLWALPTQVDELYLCLSQDEVLVPRRWPLWRRRNVKYTHYASDFSDEKAYLPPHPCDVHAEAIATRRHRRRKREVPLAPL